jgi:hypothetical protein
MRLGLARGIDARGVLPIAKPFARRSGNPSRASPLLGAMCLQPALLTLIECAASRSESRLATP